MAHVQHDIALDRGFYPSGFTVEEILRLQDLGIINEDDNFELVEGEIIPMESKRIAMS